MDYPNRLPSEHVARTGLKRSNQQRSRRRAISTSSVLASGSGQTSHAAFLLGLFLSLALAAALVESKSTSEARIRVLIE